MNVEFINDGETLRIVESTGRVQNMEKPYSVTIKGDQISVRSRLCSVQYQYDEVTLPVSTSIDNLRGILVSYLASTSDQLTSLVPVDKGGRVPVSQPVTLGDYKFLHDLLPNQFDRETGGTGSIVFNDATNSATFTTSADGDFAIMQSFQFHPYFNGRAQEPVFTGISLQPQESITKRIGYYSSGTTTPFNTELDGAFLETVNGGEVTFKIYRKGTEVYSATQSEWNDPLDGTGTSLVTVDWNNFEVMGFQFLYLGGTSMDFIMFINGVPAVIDTYVHANNVPNTIVDFPQQPIRAEIRQSGAGSGTMRFLCAEVTSLGSDTQLTGFPYGMKSGNAYLNLNTAGTPYLAIAFRLKSGHRQNGIFLKSIASTISAGSNETGHWELWKDADLATGSYGTWIGDANSCLEWQSGDGTTTIDPNTGVLMQAGTGASRSANSQPFTPVRRCGSYIDGTSEIWQIVFVPHDNSMDVHMVANYEEL